MDWVAFKLFLNRIVNELRDSKRKLYYHHYFDENKNNIKMLWRGIGKIISLKSNCFDSIPYLFDNKDFRIYDPRKMTNEFNHFFTNIAIDITKAIPRNPRSPLSYLTNPNLDSFFIIPCSS